MKIRRYSDMEFYDIVWEKILPNHFSVTHWGKDIKYQLGNVMRHASSVQIVYFTEEWGAPGDLEFDLYFDDTKLMVDITMGNAVVRSFSIDPPNKVMGTYIAKDDFKISPQSLVDLVKAINSISGINIGDSDLQFINDPKKN